MSSFPAQVAADRLNDLLVATAPAGGGTAEARASRQPSLEAAVTAFQPTDMQDLALAAQMLAGHHLSMARFCDAPLEEPGSATAIRLLRDAAAAQRMLFAAARAQQCWRDHAWRRPGDKHP